MTLRDQFVHSFTQSHASSIMEPAAFDSVISHPKRMIPIQQRNRHLRHRNIIHGWNVPYHIEPPSPKDIELPCHKLHKMRSMKAEMMNLQKFESNRKREESYGEREMDRHVQKLVRMRKLQFRHLPGIKFKKKVGKECSNAPIIFHSQLQLLRGRKR